MNKPCNDLAYFTEWGGKSWESLLSVAIGELKKNNCLENASFLDIGTRYGKMAVLFSLMGARVTGIDIQERSLEIAREEARKWNVSNVNFMAYNGDLDLFPDESFDVIFTKSVLVVVPDLEGFLKKISMKLKPDGRVVFLENGKGIQLLHKLRAIRHRNWNSQNAHFFTAKEVDLVHSIFSIDTEKKTTLPPVWLFIGKKRA